MRCLQIEIDAGQRERLPANTGLCPLRSLVTAAAAGAPKKPGGAFAKVPNVAPLKTEIAMVLSTPVLELGLGSRRRHW